MLCRPCNKHRLPMWLGCALLTIDLSLGSNYGTFVVEWWTPMCSKKEPKSLVARNIIFIKMGEWLDNESASFTIEEPWCR